MDDFDNEDGSWERVTRGRPPRPFAPSQSTYGPHGGRRDDPYASNLHGRRPNPGTRAAPPPSTNLGRSNRAPPATPPASGLLPGEGLDGYRSTRARSKSSERTAPAVSRTAQNSMYAQEDDPFDPHTPLGRGRHDSAAHTSTFQDSETSVHNQWLNGLRRASTMQEDYEMTDDLDLAPSQSRPAERRPAAPGHRQPREHAQAPAPRPSAAAMEDDVFSRGARRNSVHIEEEPEWERYTGPDPERPLPNPVPPLRTSREPRSTHRGSSSDAPMPGETLSDKARRYSRDDPKQNPRAPDRHGSTRTHEQNPLPDLPFIPHTRSGPTSYRPNAEPSSYNLPMAAPPTHPRPLSPSLSDISMEDIAMDIDGNGFAVDTQALSHLKQGADALKRSQKQLRALHTRLVKVQADKAELEKKYEAQSVNTTSVKAKALEKMKKAQQLFADFKGELDACKGKADTLKTMYNEVKAIGPALESARKDVKEHMEAISPLMGRGEDSLSRHREDIMKQMKEVIEAKAKAEEAYEEARKTIDLLRSEMEQRSCELAETRDQVARLERRQEEDKAAMEVAKEARALCDQVNKQDYEARKKKESDLIESMVKTAELEALNLDLQEKLQVLKKEQEHAVNTLKHTLAERDVELSALKKETTIQKAELEAHELKLKRLLEEWKADGEAKRIQYQNELQSMHTTVLDREKDVARLQVMNKAFEEKLIGVQNESQGIVKDYAALQEEYRHCNAAQLKLQEQLHTVNDELVTSGAEAEGEKTVLRERISELEATIAKLNNQLRKMGESGDKDPKSRDVGKMSALEKEMKQCKQELEAERQRAHDEKSKLEERIKACEAERETLQNQLATFIDRYRHTSLTDQELALVQVVQEDMRVTFELAETSSKNDVKRLQSENERLTNHVQTLQEKLKIECARNATQSSASPTQGAATTAHEVLHAQTRDGLSHSRRGRNSTMVPGSTSSLSAIEEFDVSQQAPFSTVNPKDLQVSSLSEMVPAAASKKRPRNEESEESPGRPQRTAPMSKAVPTSKTKARYGGRRR